VLKIAAKTTAVKEGILLSKGESFQKFYHMAERSGHFEGLEKLWAWVKNRSLKQTS
jgi:hypothetical protein